MGVGSQDIESGKSGNVGCNVILNLIVQKFMSMEGQNLSMILMLGFGC